MRLAILAALPLLATGCIGTRVGNRTVKLNIAGAQIPVELVSSWLDDAKTTSFQLTPITPIYLSQHGYDALARGTADIACTDRPLEARELEAFGDRKPVGYRVAFYGYGLYVNVANTVDSVFAGHISLLFRKEITNWKQLGGPNLPVALFGPHKETRGGQLLSRQARIWFDRPTWEPFDTAEEIVRRVADDPGGLGFAPIGYDTDTRYLGIRMTRDGEPAWPSLEEIEADKYGLAKLIYVYTTAPVSPQAQSVIDYLLSPAGVAAIESTNLRPVPAGRARLEARN